MLFIFIEAALNNSYKNNNNNNNIHTHAYTHATTDMCHLLCQCVCVCLSKRRKLVGGNSSFCNKITIKQQNQMKKQKKKTKPNEIAAVITIIKANLFRLTKCRTHMLPTCLHICTCVCVCVQLVAAAYHAALTLCSRQNAAPFT